MVLVAVIGGCATRVANHGNRPDPDRLAQIQPGVQTKAQVQTMIGSPSTTGAFEDNTWYYISQVGERAWMFPEDAVEREVVMIRFDESGKVASVDSLTLEDGRDVNLVDRQTPTQGQQLTFLQQLWQAFVGGPGFLGGTGNVDDP
jgi:outer membrane protein assembly factor BamE (lipoprotein component of BamABCDE complex)